MKLVPSIIVCLLAASPAFAQFPEKPRVLNIVKVTEKGKVVNTISALPQSAASVKAHVKKTAVGGWFTTPRKQPIKGVRTFLYKDSTNIAASGYTDATGYYETNTVAPGNYRLRILFPNSNNALNIINVPVVKGYITEVSQFKTTPPEGDTVLDYSELAPKIETKKKTEEKKVVQKK